MKMFSGSLAVLIAGALLFFVLRAPAAQAGKGGATLTVDCDMGESLQTDGIDKACSGTTISVTGTCNEAVTVGMTKAANPLCPVSAPFEDLTIRGTSGKKGATGTTIEGFGGPAITVNSNAIRIKIEGLTVGSDTGHGIAISSAHRVTLSNITTPSPLGTVGDGVNVDTLSTNTEVSSSTLNGNGGDGVQMGATYGMINNVTANDNMDAGIHVTGDNVSVERCTAHNTAAFGSNDQQFGFQVAGATAVVQKCIAQDNTVAQYNNTGTSTGVILFRNTAGDSRATVVPASGKGVWEEGSGNYISNFTVTRNAEEGVHLAGDGNQLQRSSVFGNVGAQVLVEGDRNLVTSVSATRLGVAPDPFLSGEPVFNVLPVSEANFFNSTSASVESGAGVGEGYSIPDLTTTGNRNSRRPSLAGDPPDTLK